MQSPKRKLLLSLLKKTVEYVGLKDEGAMEISFVGPRVMARINKDFLNHQGITDVISFVYDKDIDNDWTENEITIELIISVDFAIKEGAERKDSSYEYELVLYIVHGMLHAVGEDDLDDKSRKIMRRREKEVMTKLQKEFCFKDIFLNDNGI